MDPLVLSFPTVDTIYILVNTIDCAVYMVCNIEYCWI